jgi:hypothetical protein
MKNIKLPLIAVLSITLFSITSCRKNYTCTCSADLDEDGTVHPIEETISYPLFDQKKGEVESACKVAGSTWYAAGGSCSYKVAN